MSAILVIQELGCQLRSNVQKDKTSHEIFHPDIQTPRRRHDDAHFKNIF
jgi:hypothetical protein